MLRYIPSVSTLLRFLSWMGLNSSSVFLNLLRWSCGFGLVCYCDLSHWLICICWTILLTLGWIQFGSGVWSFCVIRFGLADTLWDFLHPYSSKIQLACNFLFWWYSCLVLVCGWRCFIECFCSSSIFWKSLRVDISYSLFSRISL